MKDFKYLPCRVYVVERGLDPARRCLGIPCLASWQQAEAIVTIGILHLDLPCSETGA